jgi:hypothetical protein
VKEDSVQGSKDRRDFSSRRLGSVSLSARIFAGVALATSLNAWAAEPPVKRLSKQEQAKQDLVTAQADATATATAALKAELERRLKEQDEASKKREDGLREEAQAAVEGLRKAADEQLAAEKTAREKEVAELRTALEASKAEQAKQQAESSGMVRTLGQGISLYGLVHADLTVQQGAQDQINPDNGQPLNTDRFLVRRARLGLQMDRRHGEGGLEIDGNTVNGPTFRLMDAHASAMLPGAGGVPLLMATIGLVRTPFGAEVPQADKDRFFLERSLAAQALFPDEFDLGFRLMGGWQFLRYALAVQNGEPLGAGRFAGLDPNKKKDIVGRLGVEDEVVEGVFVRGGASILRGYGFHPGTQPTKGSVSWNDANSNGTLDAGEMTGIPGSTASASSSFSRFAVGGDLLIAAKTSWLGDTSLAANVYFANDLDRGLQPADPLAGSANAQARSFRELGYNVALTQQLTRLAAVGVRYDHYDPDRDAYNRVVGNIVPSDSSYSTFSVTGIVYGPGWGRAIVQYDINRNHLGLDSSGSPSNLASNALTLRGEVYF